MQLAMRVTLLGMVLVMLGALLVAAIPHLRGLDTTVAHGGSMEPAIGRGSLVVAKRVAPSALDAGDVIIFIRSTDPVVRITHRVVDVVEVDGETVVRTGGDANRSIDPQALTFTRPISRVEFSVPYVGYLILLARTTSGKVLLLALPLLLLVLSRLRRRPASLPARPFMPANLILPPRDSRQAALPLD